MERIVGHIPDVSFSAATTEAGLEISLGAWPDLDASTIGSIAQGDVEDVQVLNNVKAIGILSEGANRDAMRGVADQALNDDIGAVWLERDAIIVVLDEGVLDDDVVRNICVPAIQILGLVAVIGA